MTARFAYDRSRTPPAPVLPNRIGRVGGELATALTALVDSGADLTVVPLAAARGLALRPIAQIAVRGVGGTAFRASVYSAEMEVLGERRAVEVVALGEEVLLGRDVLNRLTVTLRGPDLVLEVQRRPARREAGG